MPTLRIYTNVQVDAATGSDLLKSLSKEVAAILNKPESYVLIHLNPNQMMSFGGTEEPTAFLELISLGKIGGDINKEISSRLAGILKNKLGIQPGRYYVKVTRGWSGRGYVQSVMPSGLS